MDGAEHILAHFKENRAQIEVLMDDVIDAQLDVYLSRHILFKNFQSEGALERYNPSVEFISK